MENREEIGRMLGKIPSGVGVLTAARGGEEGAMLASWIQQTSFEPPMIAVAVNKSRPIVAILTATQRFQLSLFHTNQKELFGHFARGFKPGEDPFQGIAVSRREGGVILTDAMGFLDCELVSTTDAGDHWLYLGRVIDGKLLNDGHSMVHLRRNGFSY